jgi:hypothetical protein
MLPQLPPGGPADNPTGPIPSRIRALGRADWCLPQGTYVFEATRSIAQDLLVEDAIPNRFGSPPPATIMLDPTGWQNVNHSPECSPGQGYLVISIFRASRRPSTSIS